MDNILTRKTNNFIKAIVAENKKTTYRSDVEAMIYANGRYQKEHFVEEAIDYIKENGIRVLNSKPEAPKKNTKTTTKKTTTKKATPKKKETPKKKATPKKVEKKVEKKPTTKKTTSKKTTKKQETDLGLRIKVNEVCYTDTYENAKKTPNVRRQKPQKVEPEEEVVERIDTNEILGAIAPPPTDDDFDADVNNFGEELISERFDEDEETSFVAEEENNAPKEEIIINNNNEDISNCSTMDLLIKDIENDPLTELLAPEEEPELFTRAQNGDNDAKERVISGNIRLVVHIANKYVGHGVEINDLVQEGCIGLMKAVERFDPTLGYKFSTYATWWIKQAVTRAISNDGKTIRIPVHALEIIHTLKKVQNDLTFARNEDVTSQDIADYIREHKDDFPSLKKTLSAKDIDEMFAVNSMATPTSLNLAVGEDGDSTMEDFIPDTSSVSAFDKVAHDDLRNRLIKLLDDVLEPRERIVIYMRFGLDGYMKKTLDEIGKSLNVSRERIRQIESKALRKLRLSSKSRSLEGFNYNE